MKKSDKVLILNRVCGIPLRVLNGSRESEIDEFVKSKGLEDIINEDMLMACLSDKILMNLSRGKK